MGQKVYNSYKKNKTKKPPNKTVVKLLELPEIHLNLNYRQTETRKS